MFITLGCSVSAIVLMWHELSQKATVAHRSGSPKSARVIAESMLLFNLNFYQIGKLDFVKGFMHIFFVNKLFVKV